MPAGPGRAVSWLEGNNKETSSVVRTQPEMQKKMVCGSRCGKNIVAASRERAQKLTSNFTLRCPLSFRTKTKVEFAWEIYSCVVCINIKPQAPQEKKEGEKNPPKDM